MDQLKKPLLYFLTVHILLSSLLPLAEARTSKNFALMNREAVAIDQTNQMANVEISVEEAGLVEGRMDIESSDYPISGANNRHEPKAPGRS